MPRIGDFAKLEYHSASQNDWPFYMAKRGEQQFVLGIRMVITPFSREYRRSLLRAERETYEARLNDDNTVDAIRGRRKVIGGFNVFDEPLDNLYMGVHLQSALLDALCRFKGSQLGCHYGTTVDKRGCINLELMARDYKQKIAEPCEFAVSLADFIAERLKSGRLT